ncbi:MAG: cobyric acid synthase [Muribaculum sp.]|nr:cobyric acid synthase [Muribaculum sp.]
MAKVIMVQGTMSGAGKSLLTAGLCRIMKRDGYSVAPFKSQNMALNSFITEEGLEMGRAQVMQAEAAGIKPSVCMNPVLLKPTDHTGSQVIVNGRVLGNMSAREYFAYKRRLIPDILRAFRELEKAAEIIVIEGAGSPAEINLRENDIVNMGLAELVDAPVLLVGDIDRGGVFAQLLGTLMLLEKEERERVKGLIINKFRGDPSLFTSGIEMLESRGGVPVAGVVPYLEIELEDEDSLTERFERKPRGRIDIAVIRYPRISNFTDFNVFEQMGEVSVRYVTNVSELGAPDLIFLPGSKNTMSDLEWMRRGGFEAVLQKLAGRVPICGICGGYQMLGMRISDPEGVESGGSMEGLGLLPIVTEWKSEKVCRQVRGTVNPVEGIFSALSGLAYDGYEIHMGQSRRAEGTPRPEGGRNTAPVGHGGDGAFFTGDEENVYGTYIHGIFDKGAAASALIGALAARKGSGVTIETGNYVDYQEFKNRQYEKLADCLSEHLDMEGIYGMLRASNIRR